jgi:pyruvate kinase
VIRRTRIVATLGPASSSDGAIAELIDAGVDVVRLNLSHGAVADHIDRLHTVRARANLVKRSVAVLADLPGPKVRLAPIAGELQVRSGDVVQLVAMDEHNAVSEAGMFAVDYPHLLDELIPGVALSLRDGTVRVRVDEVNALGALGVILDDAVLSGRPGVHLPSTTFGLRAPTERDLELIPSIVSAGVDFLAVSFVRDATDIEMVREAAAKAAGDLPTPMIVAKIETTAAIMNLVELVQAADAVMVARGDLGTECPVEDVPHLQKRIIRESVLAGRPVITATQMLESMTTSPRPTRAEAADVANAVLDGTDAVMLSAETAIGDHPAHVVRTMGRICERAEEEIDHRSWGNWIGLSTAAIDVVEDAMAEAAWRAAEDAGATTILCCTRSGATARLVARFRPTARIVAVATTEAARRRLALAWGVETICEPAIAQADDPSSIALDAARRAGLLQTGELVAVLAHLSAGDAASPGSFSLRRVM